jgi:cytochrome c oxidase assembly protein subunit 15
MGVSTALARPSLVERVTGWTLRPLALRRLALASVIVNVGIVVTGGAVRLTNSGLGCPTWPACSGSDP